MTPNEARGSEILLLKYMHSVGLSSLPTGAAEVIPVEVASGAKLSNCKGFSSRNEQQHK